MATTTATLSIVSPDLLPSSPLSISASSTLMKAEWSMVSGQKLKNKLIN